MLISNESARKKIRSMMQFRIQTLGLRCMGNKMRSLRLNSELAAQTGARPRIPMRGYLRDFNAAAMACSASGAIMS